MSPIGWKKFLSDDAQPGLAYHWLPVSRICPASFYLGHVFRRRTQEFLDSGTTPFHPQQSEWKEDYAHVHWYFPPHAGAQDRVRDTRRVLERSLVRPNSPNP